MNSNALCWIDQTIKPAAEATISVFDHGLLYGDGIFEGLRFYHGKTFMLDAHLQRLAQSARAIDLRLPYDLARISIAVEELVAACPSANGYLRLVVTRGVGNLGIDPRKCARAKLFIIADELSVMDTGVAGVSLHLAQTRRLPRQCLDPAIKSLNYLNNILARIEANRAGMDEALMLNCDGFVSEGSVDNVFIASDGVLKTPPLDDGLLAGITRALVLDLAGKIGIPVVETSLRPDDLTRAEECFLTGTGAELIPVRRIDGHEFGVVENPMTQRIMRAFRDRIETDCPPR